MSPTAVPTLSLQADWSAMSPAEPSDDLAALDALLALSARPAKAAILGDVAFYWRVSTEDLQDPEASRARQLARATELMARFGGRIVVEYSDIGVSRSLPWIARPGGKRLLDDLMDPARGWGAVVVGEGDRSFLGDQLSQTWPRFQAAGVDLYIPDIGGPYDPKRPLDKALMTLVGLWSEQEIEADRRRVRETMASAVASEGRFMGGRAPYGYRTIDTEVPHHHPKRASEGRMERVLVIDEPAAPVVRDIFRLYLSGKGYRAIAQILDAAGVPCPSAHTPRQNPHRRGDGWSGSAIRAILMNPRYTGFEVWGESERQRPYIDPTNPGLGYVLRFAKAPREQVVRSATPTHPAIVSVADFVAAQQLRLALGAAPDTAERSGRESKYPSVLRGRVRCALCGRKMAADPKNDLMRYRCRARDLKTSDSAAQPHPTSIHVREAALLEELRPFLAYLLDPARRDTLVELLTAPVGEQPGDVADRARVQAVADESQAKITRIVAAIEEGAFSQTLAAQLRKLEQAKATALEALAPQPTRPRPTREAAERFLSQPTLARFDITDDQALAEACELLDVAVTYDGVHRTSSFAIQVAGLNLDPRPGRAS